ncbi:MAG: RagB/SusD family nutrient uptake outer membrane protein [Bacteroidota bacterium]
MKYIVISSLLVAVMGLTFYSCSEDFLDTPPQGSLDQQTLASGVAGVETSLVSAYKSLHGWTGDWGNGGPWGASPMHQIFGSYASDDAYTGTEPSDGPDQRQIELYQWTSSNPNLNDKFVRVYEGIARSNATIKLASGLDDKTQADRITGEATFLRAHFHFDAWKMWKNVPHYTQDDTDFRKPNDVDILPLIIADLETAISLLPADQNETGRVDKSGAQALLGRVLLYAQDFSGAKSQLDAVVNSGKYGLHDCFHNNFLESEENGVESVFSIQFSVNDGSADGHNARFADRLGMPHAGSPFGCCGFHQPSQNHLHPF